LAEDNTLFAAIKMMKVQLGIPLNKMEAFTALL